ncbi:MAG: PEP-CTERM sorting domain-containing protein [Opitutales bacterium]
MRTFTLPLIKASVLALTAFAFAGQLAVASVIPMSWDFGSDTGKDDLTDFTVTGTSSLQADAARLSRSSTSFGTIQALTQFTDLGSGANKNFEIQSVFTPVQSLWSQDFERVGLVGLASSGTSDSSGIAAVLHRGSGNSPVLLFRDGINGGSNTSQAWTGNFATGETYMASLKGTYSGANVTLDFTLTDSDSHSQTLSETFTVASRDGQYFGFGARGNATGAGDLQIDYDTFSVIPEPGTLALLGIAGLSLVAFGRRRKD